MGPLQQLDAMSASHLAVMINAPHGVTFKTPLQVQWVVDGEDNSNRGENHDDLVEDCDALVEDCDDSDDGCDDDDDDCEDVEEDADIDPILRNNVRGEEVAATDQPTHPIKTSCTMHSQPKRRRHPYTTTRCQMSLKLYIHQGSRLSGISHASTITSSLETYTQT